MYNPSDQTQNIFVAHFRAVKIICREERNGLFKRNLVSDYF